MTFWFPFLNFLQPGILWPALAPYRPMVLASLLAVALTLGMRRVAALRADYVRHPVFVWLCVFMVIQVISVYYSGFRSMLEEFDFWLIYPLFVIASLLLIRDVASLRRYIWGVMLGSAVVIGYGLVEVAIKSPDLAGGRAGAYGLYENHNDYTFIILMVLPFIYYFIKLSPSRTAKLVLLTLLGACVAGVILSLSRGGILALVLEFILIFAASTRGSRRLFALGAMGLIGAVAITHQFEAREENQAGSYTAEDARTSRYELWRAAGHMVVKHPLLGVGSRRFHEFAQDYGEISHDNRGKVAHNTIIEVAADTGFFGLASFLMMLYAMTRALLERGAQTEDPVMRAIKSATLITLVTIVFRSLLDAKVHDWSFYTLAVISIAVSVLTRRQTAQQPLAAVPTSVTSSARLEETSIRPAVYGRYH
jgi:O-antigen ligase